MVSGRTTAARIALACIALALGRWLAAGEGQEPRCLIVNSYHPAYAWTEEQTRGVLESLARAGIPISQIAIEYLDAKRQPGLAHGEAFARLIEAKYRTAALACVVTTDNPAFDFCVASRERLFPAVPLVFSGINGYAPEMVAGRPKVTGVVETMDIAGTLRLALRLHPRALRLAVVYDQTVTGLQLRADFDHAWRELGAPLPCVPLTDLSLAELRGELGRFGSETIVLLLSFATDRLHQVVEQTEEADLIHAACASPLYGLHEQRLGHGIVGGMLLSGRTHGERAGAIAAAILRGADPGSFPVETANRCRPMFDAAQLAAWGIPRQALPAGSEVVNEPRSVWTEYRVLVLAASAVAIGLLGIIAALVASILARRRTAARLAASERFLSETQRIAQTGSYSLDTVAGTWECTETLREVLGIAPDHPRTVDGWLAAVHPDDRQAMHDHLLKEVLGQLRPFDRVYRVRPPIGGGDRWVHGRGQLVLDAAGRPVRMIGTIQDVTAQTLADAALRSSEQRFREVIEHLPIPIAIVEGRGALSLLNQAFTQCLGYTRADLPTIAEWWPQAYPDPAYRAEAARRWEQAVLQSRRDGGTTEPQEFAVACKDGGVRQVEIIARPLGATMIVSLIDVTDRRQAQTILREAAGHWQATFDAVRDAIWLLDADQRIVRSNRAAEAFAGRPAAEVVGLRCWEVAHHAQHQAASCPVARARTSLRRETGELRIGERLYEVTADPVLDAAGAYAGCVHLVSDVTEVRRLEERLRHTEKLNAIGQLAGGVAHDFNNQLAGIMGFAELLARRLADPEQQRHAANILTAARRSADLTGKLLAFARKGQYLRVPVDIHALIAEAAAILSRSIDPRIRIEQRLEAATASVVGDPSQLQNALLNLGLNARDAMPAGGTLAFSTAQVELSDADDRAPGPDLPAGDYLRIVVADTGCGMDDTVKAHLFEPFFTTKGPGKGTGMGLPAVYGTIRAHGGAIAVASEVGRGTAITIHLPLARRPPPASEPTTERIERPRRQRILVVDDEPMVRELLAEMLAAAGHEVLQAADGRAAVALYREEAGGIDLVILDMVMPEMDGRDTFRALRDLDPGVAVLVASGFSLDGEAQGLVQQGVRGFLQKPFQQSELMRWIGELARR